MERSRRLPPVLRMFALAGIVILLAAMGANTRGLLLMLGNGEPSRQIHLLAFALLELGLAGLWPFFVYTTRHATFFGRPPRSALWLDDWQGQLLSAAVLVVLPLASVLVAVLMPSGSPLYGWAYASGMLLSLVCLAGLVWAAV